MTGPGTDPNTGGAVSLVAPGGGIFSARLGNDQVDSQAEQLSYSMTVDANNSLFLYRYAVVLQDPSHDIWEQPRFQIRMFDQTGAPIACGEYDVTASAGIPGFESYVDGFGDIVIYKDWTTVGMDLSSYSGQTVTIEFATGDCSLGGHYGYAYMDCYCSPLAITSDFCPGLATTELEAPLGFASYLWSTGETTPSIVVDNPTTGQLFSVTLTSVTGCAVTLNTTLTPSVVAGGYGQTGDCMNAVQFTDNSQVTSGPPITQWQWDFGDGTPVSNDQNPSHAFTTPGDHQVTLIVQSAAGCPDTLVQTITLLPSPIVDFTHTSPCLGDPVEFEDVSVMGGSPLVERRWDLGDGTPPVSVADPNHLYSALGNYDVELFLSAQNGCQDSLTVTITVNPLPTVDLGADQVVCEGDPLTLDAANTGASFDWNTGAQSQLLTPDSSGQYWVVVTLPTGCASADSIEVLINPLPVLTLEDTITCVENNILLDAGNPGSAFVWTTGAITPSITVSNVGGSYGVTVTTPQGCVLYESATITFIPAVQVDLGPDQLLCDLDQSVLDAGFFPNSAYTWSDGSTAQQLVVVQSGDVWVQVSNGYCADSDTVGLLFSPLPVIPLVDTTLCEELVLTLDAGDSGGTYLWSTGATTRYTDISLTSGPYGVVVTTPDQCVDSLTVQVTFIPRIVLDLGPDSILCQGEVLTFDAGNANSTYFWSDGSVGRWNEAASTTELSVFVTNGYCTGSDTVNVQVVQYPEHASVLVVDTCFEVPNTSVTLAGSITGTYFQWSTGDTLREITVHDFGTYILETLAPPRCAVVDTIRVREHCPPRVFVPNTFTPDGDGHNDAFLPIGYNVRTVQMLIFDRWGELVFSSAQHDEAWDGTSGGQLVPDGVYNYRFTFMPLVDVEGTTGSEQTMVGHVNVLR